jgi:hypothetical protein
VPTATSTSRATIVRNKSLAPFENRGVGTALPFIAPEESRCDMTNHFQAPPPQRQYRQNTSNQRMTSTAVLKAVATIIVSGVNA